MGVVDGNWKPLVLSSPTGRIEGVTGNWRLLRMGENTPAFNMAVDDALLRRQATHPQPILRIYGWDRPALSLGYFQEVPGIRLPVPSSQFPENSPAHPPTPPLVTRRPTGGGAVIHDGALTFSVIAPAETPGIPASVLESYEFFGNVGVVAFRRLGVETARVEECSECDASFPNFCLLRPTQHDVAFDGRKVAGAAQRRTRDGLLHQAYVVVRFPSRSTFAYIPFDGMETAARRTTVSLEEAAGRAISWEEVADALVNAFQEMFDVRFDEQPLSDEEAAAADARLAAVYARDEWISGDRMARKRLVVEAETV